METGMKFSARWLAIGAVCALAAVAPATAQTVKLDMANEYNQSTPLGAADVYFAGLVKAKTSGSVDVVNHLNNSLNINSRAMMNAVGTGAVPLGNFPIQVAAGVDPIFLMSSLPFIAATAQQSHMLQDVMRPSLERALAKEGQILLYLTAWPSGGVWSKTPITSMAAFNNQKIRTNDAVATDIFKAAGASPVQMSWGDLMPQLQTGAVTMVHTSNATGVSGRLWESLQHYTDIGMVLAVNAAVMNKDAFDKLTPAQKTAITDAAKETEAWWRSELVSESKKNDGIIASNGGKIRQFEEVDPAVIAKFRELGKPIVDAWLQKAGKPGADLLAEYRRRAGIN
jgi:TRAP-type C4-dicarboxylate transport system substrate-binding protein